MRAALAAIRAAYVTEAVDESWLRGVLEAAAPGLDQGLGMLAYFFDASDARRLRVWAPAVVGAVPSGWRDAWTRNLATTAEDVEHTRRLYLSGSAVKTVSERLGKKPERVSEYAGAAQLGMRDFLGVVATDPTGLGSVLCVNLPRARVPTRGEVEVWSRVAAHIAAGLRIRRQLALLPEMRPEAVLRSDGKLEHAEPPAAGARARQALRDAVVHLERTRARGKSDPAEAIAEWRALVAGRWSVIDHFDSDGRRYLLARRNDPGARPRQRLTARECQTIGYAALGHSNKLIAYELGLAESTVATHVSNAAAKLGCSSRTALVQLARIDQPRDRK
jgi:DNA-binding CsgD family transcriptional regulator